MSALAVVLHYRNLETVEHSFLAAKALLAPRPVFHHTLAAIPGHAFCTCLALEQPKDLPDRLAGCGGTVPEWQCMVDASPPSTVNR